jgi:hypothetical protein
MSGSSAHSLREVHARRDYLNHGDLLKVLSRSEQVEYRHANYLFTGGEWQNYRWEPLGAQSPPPRVLVIGHSDTIVSEEIVKKIRSARPSTIIFASNASEEALSLGRVYDLPLGIPNRDRSTRTHRVQSSRLVIQFGWASSRLRSPRNFRGVFSNFTARNNVSERAPILELVNRHQHLQQGEFRASRSGRLRDLINIGFWGLNICPQGNGPDTHRVWETLLMGAFPVILAKDHVFRLLNSLRLPNIALDDWSQLGDVDFLAERFESLREQDWDLSPVTTNYWVERISGLAENND